MHKCGSILSSASGADPQQSQQHYTFRKSCFIKSDLCSNTKTWWTGFDLVSHLVTLLWYPFQFFPPVKTMLSPSGMPQASSAPCFSLKVPLTGRENTSTSQMLWVQNNWIFFNEESAGKPPFLKSIVKVTTDPAWVFCHTRGRGSSSREVKKPYCLFGVHRGVKNGPNWL